jgi:hypothetical protein
MHYRHWVGRNRGKNLNYNEPYRQPSEKSKEIVSNSRFWANEGAFMKFVIVTALMLFSGIFPIHAIDLGPLYDSFPLTLVEGKRTEMLGPILSIEKTETDTGWTFSPLMSFRRNPGVENTTFDLLYPIVTHDQYGKEYRFQIFQIFSFSGGQTRTNDMKKRFTLFPFYFQQRGPQPEDNYTGLLPIYGTVRNRLLRDRVHWILMPLYVSTDKRGMTTDNYLLPFFHIRHGAGVKGWQFWPVVGTEHKDITTKTNGFGDIEQIPGYDKFFAAWPFFFRNDIGIGSTNQEKQRLYLPIYAHINSPARETTAYGFPLGFTKINNREGKYKEWGAPWPLITRARGEGKHANRIWPLFGFAKSPTAQSDFIVWPVYKYNRIQSEPLDRKRTRILFFLYSDTREKNTATGQERRRQAQWPLFEKRKDLNGNERLQVGAILEPLIPGNTTIERLYSPIWSVWRSEKNAKTGALSQSLLWNLYRKDETKEGKKVTALFGLFQWKTDESGKHVRVFYIPFKK